MFDFLLSSSRRRAPWASSALLPLLLLSLVALNRLGLGRVDAGTHVGKVNVRKEGSPVVAAPI